MQIRDPLKPRMVMREDWTDVLSIFGLAPQGTVVSVKNIEAELRSGGRAMSVGAIGQALRALANRGLVSRLRQGQYVLTDAGLAAFPDE